MRLPADVGDGPGWVWLWWGEGRKEERKKERRKGLVTGWAWPGGALVTEKEGTSTWVPGPLKGCVLGVDPAPSGVGGV